MFANLIFHSLAARYAKVLDRVAFHSGKKLKRLFVVGGASQNDYLNRLTQEATGLELFRGAAERFDGWKLRGADGGARGQSRCSDGGIRGTGVAMGWIICCGAGYAGEVARVRDRLPLHVNNDF